MSAKRNPRVAKATKNTTTRNSIIESATTRPDGRIVLVLTPRASQALTAAAILQNDGAVALYADGVMRSFLECDLCEAEHSIARILGEFEDVETEQPASAAA